MTNRYGGPLTTDELGELGSYMVPTAPPPVPGGSDAETAAMGRQIPNPPSQPNMGLLEPQEPAYRNVASSVVATAAPVRAPFVLPNATFERAREAIRRAEAEKQAQSKGSWLDQIMNPFGVGWGKGQLPPPEAAAVVAAAPAAGARALAVVPALAAKAFKAIGGGKLAPTKPGVPPGSGVNKIPSKAKLPPGVAAGFEVAKLAGAAGVAVGIKEAVSAGGDKATQAIVRAALDSLRQATAGQIDLASKQIAELQKTVGSVSGGGGGGGGVAVTNKLSECLDMPIETQQDRDAMAECLRRKAGNGNRAPRSKR